MRPITIHPGALHYRCIDTDYGGTYTHRPRRDSDSDFATETLPAIGTYKCSSCVGVYMRLSPTSCLVAHINASHTPLDYSKITHENHLYDLRIVTDFSDVDAQRRFWTVDGFATMACGGTHPASTGEVGMLTLRRRNTGKGKERIEVMLVEPEVAGGQRGERVA